MAEKPALKRARFRDDWRKCPVTVQQCKLDDDLQDPAFQLDPPPGDEKPSEEAKNEASKLGWSYDSREQMWKTDWAIPDEFDSVNSDHTVYMFCPRAPAQGKLMALAPGSVLQSGRALRRLNKNLVSGVGDMTGYV